MILDHVSALGASEEQLLVQDVTSRILVLQWRGRFEAKR